MLGSCASLSTRDYYANYNSMLRLIVSSLLGRAIIPRLLCGQYTSDHITVALDSSVPFFCLTQKQEDSEIFVLVLYCCYHKCLAVKLSPLHHMASRYER